MCIKVVKEYLMCIVRVAAPGQLKSLALILHGWSKIAIVNTVAPAHILCLFPIAFHGYYQIKKLAITLSETNIKLIN